MERRVVLLAAVLAAALIPTAVLAQANLDLRYDPATVRTISGTVLRGIDFDMSGPGGYGLMSTGMNTQTALIGSDHQVYTVVIGPYSYVTEQGPSFTPGSFISVTGSVHTIGGSRYIVASSIASGGRTYWLRSSDGLPMWMVTSTRPPIGSGPGSMALVPFDLKDLIGVSGHIRSVYTVTTPESSQPIVVAVIRGKKIFSQNTTYKVLLGPRSLLDARNIDLGRGAHLLVHGSQIMWNGESMVAATSVEYKDKVVALRSNTTGAPLF